MMHSLAPRLFRLLALSLLVGVACHNGDGSTDEPTSYLLGAVHLGGTRAVALVGSPVRAVDADGVVVATTHLVGGGNFALTAKSWTGFVGRIEVDANVPVTTGGTDTVQLVREVRIDGSEPQPRHQWVGVPSTVVSRYLQRNPAIALPAAVEVVEAHLGIPVGVVGDTAFGETYRSPASWNELRAAATAASRSVDSFLDLLAEEVGTAPARNFRPAQPYPSLARWSGRSLQGAGPAAGKPGPTDTAAGEAEWGRWVADTRVMVDGFWMGWALKLTFNLLNGPPQPDPVLVEIQQVANDLAQLSTTLTANDVSVAWGYSAGLANQAVETIRAVQEQFLAYTQGQVRDPWLAASLLELHHQALFYAVETLRQQLAGGPTAPYGPLPSIYARGKAIARFGVNPDDIADAAWLSMQLRDNDFLAEVQRVVDYYVGWGNLGLNLLAEWAHADPATFPSTAVGNTNNQVAKVANLMEYKLGSATQPGWNQSVKTAYQMAPPAAIGSDDVLVDCGGWAPTSDSSVGKLMFKDIYYWQGDTLYNNDGWYDNIVVGPFGYGSWGPMYLADYQRLRSLAYAADPNDVNNGLKLLGFRFDIPGDIVFGYQDGVSGNYYRKYNFTQDTIEETIGYSDYAYFIYKRSASGDSGTIFATSKPAQLTAAPAGMEASYNNGGVVNLVSIQPYGQDPSAAFTIQDVLAWTTSAPSQVYPSNAPVPDPTDTYNLAPWTWVTPVPPVGVVNAVGQLATILSSPGASLGCTPTAWLSGTQTIQASYDTPRLASVQVTPYGQSFASTALQPTVNCFATGFVRSLVSNRPVRLVDVTRPNPNDPTAPVSVVWSVTSPSGLAFFPPGSNVLHMNRLQGYEVMQITATVTMPGGLVLSDTQTCNTQFK
ncbi:MAG: hypothetical protein RL148_2584 [Planctomycetota bacterium]